MPRSSEQVSIQIGGGHAPQCSSKLNVQWSEPPIHWVHSQGLQISCRYPCIAALVFLQDTFSALILYKRSFGTQRSSILTTSPSQHRCFSRAYVLMTSAHSSTAVYGILSCQVMRRMRRRQSCGTCSASSLAKQRAQDSLQCISVLRTEAL